MLISFSIYKKKWWYIFAILVVQTCFCIFYIFFLQETTCRFSSQIRSIYRKYQSCDSSLTFGSCTRRSGTKMHLSQPNSVVKEWKQLLSQLERRRRRKRGEKNSAYLKSGSPAGKLYIFHFVLHNGSSLSLYHCAVFLALCLEKPVVYYLL